MLSIFVKSYPNALYLDCFNDHISPSLFYAAMRDNLRTIFNRLVNAQYVERCPRPDPFVTTNSVGETTAVKGRGSKVNITCQSFVVVVFFFFFF